MKHGSLFSGIGGFDLAAQRVGFTNVWNCENDEFSKSVLAKQFPGVKQYDDITTLYSPVKVDIISGGFPCQDISNAKTWTLRKECKVNGVNGERSGLWKEFARIIGEVKPKYVLIENVPALTKKGLNIILQDLTNIGYDAEWTIISAAEFGAPHLRKRIWIVAYPICIGRKQKSFVFSEEFKKEIQCSSKWKFSRTICSITGKKTLPKNFGIHDGVSRGLDDGKRIASLGNAIVPDIAEFIFSLIKKHAKRI